MRRIVDKAKTVDGKVQIVKLVNRKGQLDRYQVEPDGGGACYSHHFSLQDARAAAGKVIIHPVVETAPASASPGFKGTAHPKVHGRK